MVQDIKKVNVEFVRATKNKSRKTDRIKQDVMCQYDRQKHKKRKNKQQEKKTQHKSNNTKINKKIATKPNKVKTHTLIIQDIK